MQFYCLCWSVLDSLLSTTENWREHSLPAERKATFCCCWKRKEKALKDSLLGITSRKKWHHPAVSSARLCTCAAWVRRCRFAFPTSSLAERAHTRRPPAGRGLDRGKPQTALRKYSIGVSVFCRPGLDKRSPRGARFEIQWINMMANSYCLLEGSESQRKKSLYVLRMSVVVQLLTQRISRRDAAVPRGLCIRLTRETRSHRSECKSFLPLRYYVEVALHVSFQDTALSAL